MKTNQEYKNIALEAMKGKWAPAVVCTIFFMLMVIAVSCLSLVIDVENARPGVLLVYMAVSLILALLVTNPLSVGYYYTFNEVLRTEDDKFTRNMMKFSFDKVLRKGWGMILMYIFVFLWSLLLIVPGIIKAYAYAMTPYILVDHPELSANEAINLSKKMMKGHKFDYFWLGLSFIGWILLGSATLGIGYLWLMPYMCTASAAFYQDVKAEYEAKTTVNN